MQGKSPIGYIDLYWKSYKGKKIDPANINDFLQHHSASFGITRSGKSNGAGRLCEELIKKGIKICVVDYKGEFTTLSEISNSRVKIINIEGRNGKEDADEFMRGNNSYIINLECIIDAVYIPYLLEFFTELWELQRQEKTDANKVGEINVPTKVFIDEAQYYVPRISPKEMPKELKAQSRNLKGMFRNIAQQGVGLGLPMHLITQRPTYLDPFIRNQCEVLVLYRQKWENDIEVYLNVIPSQGGGLNAREARRQAIERLPNGWAIYVAPDGTTREVPIRPKKTTDLSRTPGWAQQVEKMEAIKHGWTNNPVGVPSGEEEA
jgi:hypothetical protein